MCFKFILFFVFILIFSAIVTAQNFPAKQASEPPTLETIEKLTKEVSDISKSLATFNERLSLFLESLNKYKGIQLSERQQRLLFGYEILNQTEQLAATLRKSLIETGEREAVIKRRVAQLDVDLRPENVERGIQFKGTTQTEEARDGRRRTLAEERNTLQTLLNEISTSRARLAEELRTTENFAESYKRGLFNQIREEMKNY